MSVFVDIKPQFNVTPRQTDRQVKSQ